MNNRNGHQTVIRNTTTSSITNNNLGYDFGVASNNQVEDVTMRMCGRMNKLNQVVGEQGITKESGWWSVGS